MTTSAKNNLSSNVSKDVLFSHIDEYFRTGQANIEMEVSREDILKELTPELRRIEQAESASRGADTAAQRAANKADDAAISARKAADFANAAVALAREALDKANRSSGGTFTVEIKRVDLPTIKVDNPHKQFSTLLSVIATGCHAFLSGPAGSGKTTAAEQVAKALNLPFHFTGAVATEFQLTGFVDARGIYHTTPFRRWCEQGGVFLWDEIDASDARALLRFNAALANRICEFPDGEIVKLHESCVTIAAANTYGQGADRVYVGRNQLDGASLDRFVFIAWEYDTDLEMRIAGNAEWVRHVQRIRTAVSILKIRAIISPRASIFGAKLLAQGMTYSEVETMTIFKGIDDATIVKIRSQMGK